MAKVSLVSGLPCCRPNVHEEQTKASKLLRVSAIAFGFIATVAGVLILKNIIGLGLLSTAVVGGPLVAFGLALILTAICLKCIKAPSFVENPQLFPIEDPQLINPNPPLAFHFDPIDVSTKDKLNNIVELLKNKNWHSIHNIIHDLSEIEQIAVFPWAIWHGEPQIIQGLLEKNSLLAFRLYTFSGVHYLPLYEAVAYSDPDIAFAMTQILLTYDNKFLTLINAKNHHFQMTALHRAISCSSLKLVQLLIACKADVNALNSEGFTPLHCLLYKPNTFGADVAIFQLLVDAGADLHIHDNNGKTVSELVKEKNWFSNQA